MCLFLQRDVMALNLCLPHFQTSVQCNKLCADGCDVSNLVSGDPVTRRRGLKLEYFLRPPLHVTLSFRVRIELCRVEVELWPWGMEQGRTSRRLEISSCPDPLSQGEQDLGPFKLVARCDLQNELHVCFLNPTFKPRPPFPDSPPQVSAQAKCLQLWSRGPQSLGSVARLRVSIPYSGAAAALGIKSLSVWGLPARGCSPADVQLFQEAHRNSLQLHPALAATASAPLKADQVLTDNVVPEEFLDPLTQELMVFPMILPSGIVIDQGTLEEYQKREATWGRLPNDPFTGVPFTQNSKPVPNPLLKSRIDRLMLRTGCTGAQPGTHLLNKPQASKLVMSGNSSSRDGAEHLATQSKAQQEAKSRSVARVSEAGTVSTHVCGSGTTQCPSAKRKFELSFHSSKANADGPCKVSVTDEMTSHTAGFSVESHEERLADSLDHALNEALRGLPVFTSQTLDCTETAGQHKCLFCACLLTMYSSHVLSYSLPCGHLLCGSCLKHKHSSDSKGLNVKCPSCGMSARTSDITRVHL